LRSKYGAKDRLEDGVEDIVVDRVTALCSQEKIFENISQRNLPGSNRQAIILKKIRKFVLKYVEA
jgi:hypothetical protein